MLIVGPSGVFMRYIERVLPSLGETAVALRSLGEVVDGVKASRHDEPAVADVKGSARMATVLRRAARMQAPGSPSGFRVFWRDDVIVLDRGVARPGPPLADVAGPPQPPAAAGRQRAARADVAAGARRARPRAGPRGVRRRDAVRPGLPRLRGGLVAAARRRRGARLAARPRRARPDGRGRPGPRGAAAAPEVLGSGSRRSRSCRRSRTSRCSTSCATRSATCRRAPTTSATSTRPACSRAATTCRS